MKIRNGFVSNSSSSSFIIRGMKLDRDKIISTLNIPQSKIDEIDEDYEIFEFLSGKFGDLSVEVDGNYFGGQDYETLVIGDSLGRLEDGDVTELKDRTEEQDKTILNKFKALGFTGELSTYIQMVSNDNYQKMSIVLKHITHPNIFISDLKMSVLKLYQHLKELFCDLEMMKYPFPMDSASIYKLF